MDKNLSTNQTIPNEFKSTSINNRSPLVTFTRNKSFSPRHRGKRSVAEYPGSVFLPPLVKSISSSVGLTVEVLIVWLRQLMARPSRKATKGGNKNAMVGFIGYHWPLDAFAHQNVPIVRFV